MKDQLFNRKILFSLLAVVMCLGFTAMSYGAAVVSVDPAEMESPAVGEQLMVNINIMGGAGILGYEVDISYDPTALSFVGSANADYLPAGSFATQPVQSEGGVKISAASLAGAAPDADGRLATVTFEVVEAKASTIGIAAVILAGANNTTIESTTADGMVTAPAADDTEADDTEADDATADDTEVDDTEADDTTADDAEADDTEADDTEADDTTADDAEVDDTEADDTTADDAEADDTEADDATADDAEADDTEADDTTADDTEADDTEADDTAVDDTEAEVPAPEPVSQMFEITLTNLTTGEPGAGGQVLSAPIFAAHRGGVKLAEVGQPASPVIVALAENGDTSALAAFATAAGANVVLADGNVIPGGSVTVTVTADMVNSSLSVGSMLVSTNDAFIAAIDVPLFDENGAPVSASIDLNAYDAGSEENTEMASDIPGPLGLDEAADPAGSNERVPTEGGVIAPHEGIQGGADVGEAFAWDEPTAMLMITPVEAPVEPVVEPPPEPIVPGFDVTLGPGLNMISIPLMPAEPYTAKSLAEMLGATVVIRLDAATQSFVGYTVADDGNGFGIDGGQGYIVNTPAGAMVKFTGDAWDNQPEPPEPPPEEPAPEDVPADDVAAEDAPADDAAADDAAAEDAPADDAAADDAAADADAADAAGDAGEGDAGGDEAAADAGDAAPAAPALTTLKSAWAFIVTSDIQGMETGTVYTLVAENLRTGTIATENVTSDVRRSSAVWADLNRKSVVEAGDKLKIALYDDRGTIVSGPFQRTVATTDIRDAFLNLELTVGDVQPQDTILAQNFPNPFNPETWIPYQLSQPTEVSIQIYDVSGRMVRTFRFGLAADGFVYDAIECCILGW